MTPEVDGGSTTLPIAHGVSEMVSVDELGRAIHIAKHVGGPWGPPCGYPLGGTREEDFKDAEWVEVGYDDNSQDEFACDCRSMAHHLIEIMEEKNRYIPV